MIKKPTYNELKKKVARVHPEDRASLEKHWWDTPRP